jgi:hypothetical protein
LIEIGRPSTSAWAADKASGAFGSIGVLFGLVWILRGFLGLQQYSVDLLLASFGFIVLRGVFDTETSAGAANAVWSFLWNITGASIVIILGIWLLGWIASIQSDTFPTVISSQVPDLVIVAIVTGLGGYAAAQLRPPRKRATPAQPAFVVAAGMGPATGSTKITVKHDTVGVPIKRQGSTVGCVLQGDVLATFQTPMGAVSATLTGPVTTVRIPFRGKELNKDEVVKMTGKAPRELVEENRVRTQDVEIGPVKEYHFRSDRGERVKIGPVTFDWDEEELPDERWLAKGAGDSYVKSDDRGTTAKWNGSSLSVSGDSMKLTIGSDSFAYSPTEVKTASPLHALSVTQDKVTLDTRRFTLKVSGDTVVLRTEDKTRSTESMALADDLRTLLTETAKKQVSDVMQGTPIDLSEMFTTTDAVLAKHD